MSATDTTQPEFSAEDLELLTPEERAAISDGAEDAANQEALAKLAAGAPDDDEDDGDENETLDENGNVVVPAPDAATPAPAPADPPAAAPAPQPQVDTTPKPAPVYTAELPADFDTKQAELKASLDALREKFKGGDMEVDDYEAQREAIDSQRKALDSMRTKAEIAQEMQQQSAARNWQSAIDSMFDMANKPENGGVDYRKDAEKAADLDTFVKTLAGNPANNDKSMEWFLQEGHKRVKALHGIATAAPAPAAKPAEPASRKPPIGSVPATLAQVPGADGPGDVTGEFSDVDALDGDALESAIARMTPMQREKYMRGG